MRAVVIAEYGATPVVAQFPEPTGPTAEVLAASVNPVDVAVASGVMALRHPEPPMVLGVEGVARLATGALVQFFQPPAPFGAFADRIPLDGTETYPLPDGLDPALAAALGVSGMAAWSGLSITGNLRRGERVLVLGADGQVGRIAVQASRLLGASVVVGVVANEVAREAPLRLGADSVATSAELAGLADRLRAASPDGYDVVVDTLWGPVTPAVLAALSSGARVVQIGNAAGAEATINAPAFRNRLISFRPHSNFLISPEDRAGVYTRLLQSAAHGDLVVDHDDVDLSALPTAWPDVVAGRLPRKLIVRP